MKRILQWTLFFSLLTFWAHAQTNSLVLYRPLTDLVIKENVTFTRIPDDSVFYAIAGNPQITYTAFQVENNAQVPLPGWLTFDDDPLSFAGTPLTPDRGIYQFVLKATSGAFSLTDTFQLRVVETFREPVLYHPLQDKDVFDNTPLQWTLADSSFYDVYGMPLTYTVKELKNNQLQILPSWLHLDQTLLKFNASPARPDVGFYQIVIEASNGHLTKKDTFQIEVIKVNIPPALTKPFTGLLFEEGFEARELDVRSNFSDADGDPLTYSVSSGNSSVVNVALAGGVLKLSEVGIGSSKVTITAKDPDGAEVSDVFTVIIREYQEVFSFTTENTGSNGLVESWVRAVHIENDHELWLGTDMGLSIYNPEADTWQSFLKGGNRSDGRNQISEILETSTGTKILLVLRGFQLSTANSFEYYHQQNLPGINDFVHAGKIDSHDKLWLLTGKLNALRLVRVNLATKQVELNEPIFTENATGSSLALDDQGLPWIATSKGLVHYNGTGFTVYNKQNGLWSDQVESVAYKNGKVYAVMMGSVDVLEGQIITHLNSGKLFNMMQSFLRVDDDGSIWTSSYNNGILNYSASSGWQSLRLDFLDEGSPFVFGYPIYTAKKDSHNTTWVGTRWGLLKYADAPFPFTADPGVYNTFDGLPSNDVFKILKDDDGNMWFPTDMNGVSKYDGQSWTWMHNKLPAESAIWMQNTTAAYVAKNGDLWVGGAGGASTSTDGATWKSFITVDNPNATASNDVLNMNNVLAFGEDTAGNIWAGGTGYIPNMGINKYDGSNWNSYTVANGLKTGHVRVLFGDTKGNMWVAYQNAPAPTVSKIDANGNMVHYLASEIEGQPGFNYVTQIIESDNGKIWISTATNGIAIYDGTTWTTFKSTNGLRSNTVTQLASDGSGNIWIAYNPSDELGVSMFDGSIWQHFNKDNGLPSNQVNTLQTLVTSSGTSGSRTKTAGGTLWLGTLSEGVAKIDIDGFLSLMCDIDKPVITSQKQSDGTYLLTASITADSYQWYTNGTIVSNALGKTFIASVEGSYSVKAKKGVCVSDLSESFVLEKEEEEEEEVVTGIADPENKVSALYPNPAKQFITLRISEKDSQPLAITIVDVSGKSLSPQIIEAGQSVTISLDGLKPGIYILKRATRTGVQSRRFVKQ